MSERNTTWDAEEKELVDLAKRGDTAARDRLTELRRERLTNVLPSMTWEEEIALAKEANTDGSEARDQLIDAHLAHIGELVRQRTLPAEDYEAALEASIQAIRDNFIHYEVNRGYRFRLWYPSFITESIRLIRDGVAEQKRPEDQASSDPAQDAREGNLEQLYALTDLDDRGAYKWLHAALDFGHPRATSFIEDVLETSSLRHDDDQLEQAAAHWELAVAYLSGQGLPKDLSLAERHLARAFEVHDLQTICEGTGEDYSEADVLAQLGPDAAQLLRQWLGKHD